MLVEKTEGKLLEYSRIQMALRDVNIKRYLIIYLHIHIVYTKARKIYGEKIPFHIINNKIFW